MKTIRLRTVFIVDGVSNVLAYRGENPVKNVVKPLPQSRQVSSYGKVLDHGPVLV